jgi:hypothetical protein
MQDGRCGDSIVSLTWVNAHSLNPRHNGSVKPTTARSGCPHECSAHARPHLDASVHVRAPVGDSRSTPRRNRIRCVGVRARSGYSTSRFGAPPAERHTGRSALAVGSHARSTARSCGSGRPCGGRRTGVGAVGIRSSAGSTAHSSSATDPNQSGVDATTTSSFSMTSHTVSF